MRLGRRNMWEYINNDMCLLAKMLCGKHLSHCMEDGVVYSYQWPPLPCFAGVDLGWKKLPSMPTKWGFGGGWWTFEHLNIQRMFVCRACSNVLPTRDNLYRRVGKTFEHALHTNILTLGGTFKLHNFLQILRSAIKPECSTRCCCPIRSATWYAVLTKKLWDLFSFQTSLDSGICRISMRVLWAKRSNTLSLSHCPVASWIKSSTNRLGYFSQKNWFMCQPFMIWNINISSITNLPLWTFLN